MPDKVQTAYIQIIITDQGNGDTFCSSCHNNLDAGTLVGSACPKCGCEFTSQDIFIQQGGSDF